MSFGERLPPPPGFGDAAAGRPPPGEDFAGLLYSTPTSSLLLTAGGRVYRLSFALAK
jgi:hypothetical protein